MDEQQDHLAITLPEFYVAVAVEASDEIIGLLGVCRDGKLSLIGISESNLRTIVQVATAALQHLRDPDGNLHG